MLFEVVVINFRPVLEDGALAASFPSSHTMLTLCIMGTAFLQAGYRVPEDVSVVGFDDFLYPGLCNIPLTTYAVNMTKMAETGVKLLLKKMTGGETSEGMHLIEGHFIERKSVRAI